MQLLALGESRPHELGCQPVVEIGERLGADPVQMALGVDARLHQARLTRHPQVLEDRGLAQLQPVDEVAGGAASIVWAATLPDDGPAGGFFRDGRPLPW